MSRRHKQQMHRPACINPSLFGVLLSGTPLTRDVCYGWRQRPVEEQDFIRAGRCENGSCAHRAVGEDENARPDAASTPGTTQLTSPLISSEWRRQALI